MTQEENEKKNYCVVFKAEAFFTAVIRVTPEIMGKLKSYIGENKHILGNDAKATGWIKFLHDHAEFDYIDKGFTDLEEIDIEELDNNLQSLEPLPKPPSR